MTRNEAPDYRGIASRETSGTAVYGKAVTAYSEADSVVVGSAMIALGGLMIVILSAWLAIVSRNGRERMRAQSLARKLELRTARKVSSAPPYSEGPRSVMVPPAPGVPNIVSRQYSIVPQSTGPVSDPKEENP